MFTVMNKKFLVGKIIAFLMVVAVVVFTAVHFIGNKNSAVSQTSPSSDTKNHKIKLSDTRYWAYSFLISDDDLDDQTKAALSGFDRKKEILPNGDIKITLKALSPDYQDQNYVLKPGQKLYFIETSMADDPQFKEYNMGDDVAVKVDADGYIIR